MVFDNKVILVVCNFIHGAIKKTKEQSKKEGKEYKLMSQSFRVGWTRKCYQHEKL